MKRFSGGEGLLCEVRVFGKCSRSDIRGSRGAKECYTTGSPGMTS